MISMQFKTWLRLHEDKNMSSLPEELKPEEIAQQHFKSFLGDSLEIHKANKKKKKSDATLSSSSGKHVPIDVEIKHSLIRYLKDGITPRSADFRINHRITDIIRGSGRGEKKDLTTQDLALMLKEKEGLKRTLSDPSWKVFDHIKKNTDLKHDELHKKFKNVADFDDHYSDPANLKNYRKLIKHWWKTGNNGKPLSIDPHSDVIVVYPKGHIIRTNKKHPDEKNFNEEVIFSPYLIAQTYGDRLPFSFDTNNTDSVQSLNLSYKQYNFDNIFVSTNYYNPDNIDLSCLTSNTSCDIGLTGIDN